MKPSLFFNNYLRPNANLILAQKTPSSKSKLENYSGFNYILILALASALISHYYYMQNLDFCDDPRGEDILEDNLFYTIKHAGANT